VRERYGLFQYHFVEFLAAHLADCSRVFRGDLQQLLVLAILGQVYLRAYLDASPDAKLPRAEVPVTAAITASRIADVTGIPRETVRRKLAALERRGWIERAGDRGWRLLVREGVAEARRDLADLDQRGIERMARILTALKTYL
jgi:DNA-binding MarR family transcriptional regulator